MPRIPLRTAKRWRARSAISLPAICSAVGDRSADGASFAAEEIVTGAFQTHAGTVKSVDAAKNEVVITELQSKKDVTVSLASTSVLKKFPGADGPDDGGTPGRRRFREDQAAARCKCVQPAEARADRVRTARRDRRNARAVPDDHDCRSQVGEMIAISSSKTASLDRITAIKLLAGVEPLSKPPR